MSRKEGQARILTKTELKDVISSLKPKKYQKRNKAILMMAFKVGLRSKEIASITLDDVLTRKGKSKYNSAKVECETECETEWENDDLKDSFTLRSAVTKGSKVDSAYLASKIVRESILEYLSERVMMFQRGEIDNLFLTKRGKPFTPQSMSQLFMAMSKLSGVEFSSHSGRRTLVGNLVRKGLHIFDIQSILRHRSVQTTVLYYQQDERRLGDLMADAQNGE
jgi:integrase/recombinase XerD